MRSMKSLALQLPVLSLLLALMLPAVGVLADHHFAERQPGHLHMGVYGDHPHILDTSHLHPQGMIPSSPDDRQFPSAIYNYDSTLSFGVGIALFDVRMYSFLAFE